MEPKYNYELGFNSGYIMAKFKNALITRLASSITKSSDYLMGLMDGKAEYDMEMNKGKMEELDRLREWGRGELER